MKYQVLYVDFSIGAKGRELFLNYSDSFVSIDEALAFKADIDSFVLMSFIIEIDEHCFNCYKIIK